MKQHRIFLFLDMNGKGSKQRPTDLKQYGDNYDRIFGKKKPERLIKPKVNRPG